MTNKLKSCKICNSKITVVEKGDMVGNWHIDIYCSKNRCFYVSKIKNSKQSINNKFINETYNQHTRIRSDCPEYLKQS